MTKTISQLEAASVAALANEYEINEAGVSKKVTGTQMNALFGGSGKTFAKVIKAADQTKSSDTTLADDSELVVALNANKTYSFYALIMYNSPTTPQIKFRMNGPAGSTGKRTSGNYSTSSISANLTPIATTTSGATDGTDDFFVISGTMIVGGTAGNLAFQWSQNISDAGVSTVFEGSYLIVWEEGADVGGGGAGQTFAKVVKSVDEIVNNSAIFQDDDELLFSANANKIYHGIIFIFCNSGTVPDLKLKFTLPTSATGDWMAASGLFRMSVQPVTSITSTVVISTGATDQSFHNNFRIIVGGTAGNVTLQWAQNGADASDTKLLKGSLLLVWEE